MNKSSIAILLMIFMVSALPVRAAIEDLPPVQHTTIKLSQQGEEAAKLLGIEDQVHKFIDLKNSGKLRIFDKEAMELQLAITRKVMTAELELRTTSARLDKEITIEYQALDKLTRRRDFIVDATTDANFLQLSILSIIIDGPLEETHNTRDIRSGNNLNIISGLLVGGLGALTLLEQHGGIRNTKAEPNMLGQTLGLNAPSDEKLPPMLWTYLNSASPNSPEGLTRREQLIKYWQISKILPINIKKQSTVEKVAVLGPHHSKWSETIKMLTARIYMLFDLRAMVDLLNKGLVDLLQALD